MNFVNNTFLAGPHSTATEGCILPENPNQGTKLHLAGNLSVLTPTCTEDPWLNVTYWQPVDGKWIEHHPAPETFRAVNAFPVTSVSTQSAQKAFDLVLTHAGPKVRDADDLRVIREARTNAARLHGLHDASAQ